MLQSRSREVVQHVYQPRHRLLRLLERAECGEIRPVAIDDLFFDAEAAFEIRVL